MVTDEVRTLAQSSALTAQNTSVSITESMTNTKAGVAQVERMVAALSKAVADSANAKTLIEKIY